MYGPLGMLIHWQPAILKHFEAKIHSLVNIIAHETEQNRIGKKQWLLHISILAHSDRSMDSDHGRKHVLKPVSTCNTKIKPVHFTA
jgi:hypothetical protein